MDFYITIILAAGVLVLALGATFYLYNPRSRTSIEAARHKAKIIEAEAESERLGLKSRTLEQTERFKSIFRELEKKADILAQKEEKSGTVLEERLQLRQIDNNRLQGEISKEDQEILKYQTEIEALKKQTVPLLSKISNSTEKKIRQNILSDLDMDLSQAVETRLNKLLDFTREQSPAIAKNLLIEAIHRYSASTSVEKKNLIIPINRNETKAKVMGANCEILNLLEEELGVDIIFEDDKPGIAVSHFQLVKKHIARETIMKLIKDRVVDLEKAKQRLAEARTETDQLLLDIGNKIVQKLNLEYRHFPDDFKRILGRLKYRTSYGQNILKHCFEVGYFTLLLGNELGLNEEICKIGGFFHDLGKAIDQEDGRPHDILTKEIMESFQIFSWEEIHAAWTHHDAVPIETAEALLVKAGDAISAGRPGARQETIEKYLARVMALEGIANSYEGVNKAYAISGGRELRVLVDPKRLNDDNLPELASEITQEIEENVAYPGQIKVNVIRRVQHNRTIKDKNKKAKV